MGFIASIFCGSSEKNLNNSNKNSNNSSRTHRPTPTSSTRAVHTSSSSSSSPVTKTTTKQQKLQKSSPANSPSLSPKTSAKTHTSGNSNSGTPTVAKGSLKNSMLMNGNNEKVLKVMKTDTNSTYSSTNGTRDSSVHTKDDSVQQKTEKEITIVTQQVGDGEDEDENENENEVEMDEKTNVVVVEKQAETGEQYREVKMDAEKQVLAHTPQIQVSEYNAYEAAAPHIINQTSSVEVHETQSDSEASSQPSSPHVDAVRMTSQANTDIPPIMEANVIDLTKLQKGQAHAKGYKTLLAPKDEKRFFNKKCLILDLDETLVHSSFKYVRNADFVIPVDIDNQIHNVYVIKRPGVDKFLEEVSKIYEVVVFTASVSRYGDPLLNILDNITNPAQTKQNTIHHRLYRDSCYTYEGNYVKNLSQIGRPLEDIIILDNSPASYIFHPQHAVPVSSWFSDTHDNELIDILPILADLSGVPDVSKILDVSL